MAVIRNRKRKEGFLLIQTDVDNLYNLARKHGIVTHPFDVKAFIEEVFNIDVLHEDMDDISGYIEKRNDNWVISVNAYHNSKRQRFTLAHELAHYVLHKQKVVAVKHDDTILFRTDIYDPIEKEANQFASELLVPAKRLKEYLDDGKRDVAYLANRFQVSLQALRYKAYIEGFIRGG